MKIKYWNLPFLLALIVATPANTWAEADTPVDMSTMGAISVGAGTLGLLATPVVFAGESIENGALDASSRTVSLAGGSVSAIGTGIVFLVSGTGAGLLELTADTLQAGGTLLTLTGEAFEESKVPTVQITYRASSKHPPQRKTIPLVTRKDYVHLNDKIQE